MRQKSSVLPLVQWYKTCVHRAGVVGFGTDQAIILHLFQDVCGPACDATDGKGWREEVAGKSD